jgi:ribosomal protein L17
MLYDLKKRIFIVKMYYKTESLKAVERACQAKYGRNSAPRISTIKNIISTFEKHGSVKTPASQKREEVKNQLKTMIAENPTLSTRKAASSLQIS